MAAIPQPGEVFESAPMGTHIAICSRIVDLGTQENTFQGETDMQHQIAISWELPNERTSGGLPFLVSRYYKWSMHEKANLRKDLESWRGKKFTKEEFGSFDIRAILGKPCQVIIGESQTGKTKVVGVAGFPKGAPAPKLHDAPIYVWLSADEFDEPAFEQLSDYWRDKIKASPEWAALHAPPAPKPIVRVQAGSNGAARQPGGMSGEDIARREMGGGGELSDDFSDDIPF